MKKITFFLSLMFCSLSFSQNLVTNGDFQTGTAAPWYGNAANVVDLGASNFVNQANVTAVGNPFDVNLSQNINLTNGLTYELTFTAFTDATTATRNIIVGLGQNNAPWAALTSTTSLTSTPQTFSYQYTINYGDAVADRVIFDLGAATGFVFIDNVSVVEVVNTCANGIQDGTETGIDCGGSCAACIPTPTDPATTPPARPIADVVSIYSDAYSNLTVSQWGPDWGPASARINDFPVQSNPTKVIDFAAGKVFAGIDFASVLFDATTFTTLHVDYWIGGTLPVGQVMSIKLSNHNGGMGETSAIEFLPSPLLTNQWVSLDIPLSSFIAASAPANLSRNAIAQIVITAARADNNVPIKIYLDNIYFHKNTVLSSNSFDVSKTKLYPNPTANVLNIESVGIVQNIAIYNVLGQEVLNREINATSFQLDVASLNAGIYVVKAMIDGNVSSTKFIKE